MRASLVACLIVLAGCAAGPPAPDPQLPDGMPDDGESPSDQVIASSPSGNLTTTAQFEGCTGADPGQFFPPRVLPWAAPLNFSRPVIGVTIEAKLIAYTCESVDVFGSATIHNVTFAVEGHGNASDERGIFDVRYNGFVAGMAFYTNNEILLSALAHHGIAASNGTMRSSSDAMSLTIEGGSMNVAYQQVDYPQPQRTPYVYLVLAKPDPPVGLILDLDMGSTHQGVLATMKADGSMRLAEFEPFRYGVPTSYGLQEGTNMRLEVIRP